MPPSWRKFRRKGPPASPPTITTSKISRFSICFPNKGKNKPSKLGLSFNYFVMSKFWGNTGNCLRSGEILSKIPFGITAVCGPRDNQLSASPSPRAPLSCSMQAEEYHCKPPSELPSESEMRHRKRGSNWRRNTCRYSGSAPIGHSMGTNRAIEDGKTFPVRSRLPRWRRAVRLHPGLDRMKKGEPDANFVSGNRDDNPKERIVITVRTGMRRFFQK